MENGKLYVDFLFLKDFLYFWKCLRNVVHIIIIVKSKIGSLDDKRPMCGKEEDAIGHALIHCDCIKASWFGFQWSLFFYSICSTNLIEWLKNSCENGQPNPPLGDTCSRMGILSMWWIIWKGRNDFIYNGQTLDPPKIISLAQKILEDPISLDRDLSLRKDENLSKVPKVPIVISNKEDNLLRYSLSLRRVMLPLVL